MFEDWSDEQGRFGIGSVTAGLFGKLTGKKKGDKNNMQQNGRVQMPDLHNFWYNDNKAPMSMQPMPHDPVFLSLLLLFELISCILWFLLWTTLDQR